MEAEKLIYTGQLKTIKMTFDVEPSILGFVTIILTINEINSWLQGLLIIVTLVYTSIKIIQLLKKK